MYLSIRILLALKSLTVKLVKLLLLSAIISLGSTSILLAQADKRIQRLATLAKIWGEVKFIHPYIAYRSIDWDRALINAIPKVNAARTAEEYSEAINLMLGELKDNQTFSFVKTKISNDGKSASEPEPVKLESGILHLNVLAAAKYTAQSKENLRNFNQKFFSLYEQAKSVLIDSRTGENTDQNILYDIDYNTRNIISEILDSKITLGTIRYRLHNGYPPQDGSTSGGYYSGFTTDAPVGIGKDFAGAPKMLPMVILMDKYSALSPLYCGLQSAGKAIIVSESNDLGTEGHTLEIGEGLMVSLRTAEMVSADGAIGFMPDVLAEKGNAMPAAMKILSDDKFRKPEKKLNASSTPQISQKDNTYAEMEFPNSEYRLLALFRFWNVINYFFPYKQLTGTNWDTVLTKYIPQFEANRNVADYRLSAGKLVAEIHDSHGFFSPPRLKNPPQIFLTPTVEAYAENQTYIRGVLEKSSGFRTGDVVKEVDGIPIDKILENFSVRISASTSQSMMRQVHGYGIFRGEKDSKAVFVVKGLDGKIRKVETVRNVAANDPRFNDFKFSRAAKPVISILSSGFAYVDLDRLQPNQVDSMFKMIMKTPAVIFDMRGYPNGTAWQIAPRLSTKVQPIAALFDNPLIEGKNISDGEFSGATNFTFSQRIPKREHGEVYKGRVVMLIDETAQSQAEHTALFFEAARPDITFIGMPTAGANGDVTNLILPGNIKVSFSGHGVRHADGRQLQRLGIQPTIKVAPSIRGIIQSKDEILDAALKFLKQQH